MNALKWTDYNEQIRKIRDKFYLDQQALRAQKDAKVAEVDAWYTTEIAKLRAQYEADVTSARKTFATSPGA